MTDVEVPAERSRDTRQEPTIVAVVLVLISLCVGAGALQIAARSGLAPSGPAMVPLAVSAGLLFFSFLFLIEARKRTDAHLERHLRAEDASTHLGTVLWVLVVLVVYAVVIGPVGYLVATAAMFAVVSRALGSRRWVLNVGVGIALSAAAYFGFTLLLGVRLPAGFLEMVL